MKKLAIAVFSVLVLSMCGIAQAKTYFEWGGVELIIPLSEVNGVFLYDFNGKETLLAGETPILRVKKLKNLALTVGGAGDASSENEGELRERDRNFIESGTPFFGFHIDVLGFFDDLVSVGFHYGRNLNEGKAIYGIKSSVKLW